MREIKFRLWHRKNKGMYAHNFMWGSPSLHGGGYVRCVPFGDELKYDFMGYGNEIQIEPQECEIMQFTGLHDKDGKEIYEGDIIALRNWGIRDNEQFGIGSVTWDEWNACWDIEPYQSWLEDRDDFRKCLSCSNIIGNIYENPDLC